MSSRTPIDLMLDDVQWEMLVGPEAKDDDIPYATHEGVLEIAGHRLRCYRLSTGQAVFHADDIREFFGDLI